VINHTNTLSHASRLARSAVFVNPMSVR
jgi:hypothetical protein